MKKIFLSMVLFCFFIPFSYAGGVNYTLRDLNYATEVLMSTQGGKSAQKMIDSVLAKKTNQELAQIQKKISQVAPKVYNKTPKDRQDVYIANVIYYISVKSFYIQNPDIAESQNSVAPSSSKVGESTCDIYPVDTYYNNGLSEGWVIPNSCVKDRSDGILSEYYENGQARFEIPLKDGYYDGLATWYHENGMIRAQGNYKNGKIIGEYYWYDALGNITQKNTYLADDMIHVTLYFPLRDVPLWTYSTKNGRYHGTRTEYYVNGQVRAYVTYRNGVPFGKTESFYKNGALKSSFGGSEPAFTLPELKIQVGDSIVYDYLIYDAVTKKLLDFGTYEEIVDDSMILPNMQEALLGITSPKNIVYTLKKPYTDPTHPLYNLDIQFDIMLHEISR